MTIVSIGNNTGNAGGMADDRIDTHNTGAYNQGAHLWGYCGGYTSRELRELQRFDLSSIPAGSVCDAATLYLYDTNWSLRTVDNPIAIYRIAAANGDWIEGTQQDEAQVGSPCWSYKAYNTVGWAGSAGLKTAGTDYVDTVLGSATFTDGVSGYRGITLTAAGLAVLESWFGSTGGPGWILIGSTTVGTWSEWHSRQGTDGNRPYLEVTYGGRPRPARLLNGAALHRASRW